MSHLVCPKCENNRFSSTAHITETWEVDEQGEFVNVLVLDGDESVIHRPSIAGGDYFTCVACGTEAKVIS